MWNNKLAIDGGKPVRTKAYPLYYPGGMWIGPEEKKAVLEVLKAQSPFRFYGPNLLNKVQTFEQRLAAKIGVRYALGVSSGTAALRVGLTALGVGPGDEVIIPAFTFIACVNAVVMSRAIPVFAEVNKTMNLDPADFAAKITPRTRAVMPVHTLGTVCQMDEILRIAKKHGIKVIEDCAHSLGASYQGKKVGSLGQVGIFSLQINKVITTGEGGAVVTNDKRLFERALRAHDHGWIRPNFKKIIGREQTKPFYAEAYRMSELSGAMALAQLKKLDRIINAMRRAKNKIKKAIAPIKGIEFRTEPDPAGDTGHSLVFFVQDKNMTTKFIKALQAEGIPAQRLYEGKPVYAQILNYDTATPEGCPFRCPFYNNRIKQDLTENRSRLKQRDPVVKKVKYQMGMCPNTEALLDSSIWILIPSMMTPRDGEDVITAIHKVARALL